jgi:hypothetical protein
MISQSTPQQYPPYPYRPSLGEAAAWLVAQRAKQERAIRSWVCAGCGTTHTSILPEECEKCGATALEFEYSTQQTAH